MHAQRVVDHMELAVKRHFAHRIGIAHELVFQRHHIAVQSPVGTYAMGLRIARQQPLRQSPLVHQGLHLLLQRFRVRPQKGQAERSQSQEKAK